jgi:hypothetical protein
MREPVYTPLFACGLFACGLAPPDFAVERRGGYAQNAQSHTGNPS